MITLSGVTKEYRLDEKRVITPVRDVNLEIAKGELIIIIGRSGSGKTTLLNMTAGLVKPTQGNVIIDNVDLSGMNDKQLSALRNRKIGFIFQGYNLVPNLTALENVMLPMEFAKIPKDQRQPRAVHGHREVLDRRQVSVGLNGGAGGAGFVRPSGDRHQYEAQRRQGEPA